MEKTIPRTSLPRKLSDKELYARCKEYGENARLWSRKFAGILPEVFRRHLYKRRGCASIHEFAAKLAGMSFEATDKILRLSERLQDKPALREQLEAGVVGWSKIEKVSFIATPETEKAWAEKTARLTKDALEAFVKEYRKSSEAPMNEVQNYRLETAPGSDCQNNKAIKQVENSNIFTPPHWDKLSFEIDPKILRELRVLKHKLEQTKKQALAWNEVMEELIIAYKNTSGGKRKTNNPKAQKVIQLCPNCIKQNTEDLEAHSITQRYIPAEVKHFIDARSEGTCEFPECNRAAETLHHTRRFALRQNHNPDFIANLCKSHERLAHSGLIGNEEAPTQDWRIRTAPNRSSPKFRIDEKVAAFRQIPP